MKFWRKWLETPCKHDFEVIGKYYNHYVTTYRSSTDEVRLYLRLICKDCNKVENRFLSKMEYRSLVFLNSSKHDSRQSYMDELEDRGVYNKEQIEEKTIKIQLGI